MTEPTDTEPMDFSSPKKDNIAFRIDDDLFYAVPEVGGEIMRGVMNEALDLSKIKVVDGTVQVTSEVTDKVRDHMTRIMSFLDVVLITESRERFAERLQSITEPITLTQAHKVYRYLLEKYADRPTTPPSPSQNGAGGIGTSLMGGAPHEE